MDITALIITSIAALMALAIGVLFANARSAKKIAQLEQNLAQREEELERGKADYEHIKNERDQFDKDLDEADKDLAVLKSQLEHANQKFDEVLGERDEWRGSFQTADGQRQDINAQLEKAKANLDQEQKKALRLQEQLNESKDEVASLRQELDKAKEERASADKSAKEHETAAQKLTEQFAEKNHKILELEEKLEKEQKRFESLNSEHAKLTSSLKEKEDSHAREVANFSKAKEELKKDFENLASKIFEEKGKTFSQTSQASIDTLLKPFREQIEGFQKRVNEVHDESIKGNTNLNAEIRKVLDIGLQMSNEANNLTSALKGDSQQRGAWGEAQLQRTLEMSGLMEDAHFEAQSSFKDKEGKHKQTDYLIKLPDGKHIIIDSKVSLVAYDRAVAAETPEEYQLAMSEHVKAVRKHIDDLHSKDYTNLVGVRSPSFVLMFMPIEPAYIEALKNNKDLFEYGYKKSIVLVSHTTLIPILRTISNLWMIARSNAQASEISEKAGEIYNSVCTVAERLNKLGGTLNTVSNHYNSTVTALAGKQGLYGKVERFSEVSNNIVKNLPHMEPAHMDFEHDRLSLIVEAIDEDDADGADNADDESGQAVLEHASSQDDEQPLKTDTILQTENTVEETP